MNRVCAWCGEIQASSVSDPEVGSAVTHGICERCARALTAGTSEDAGRFLDVVDFPVLMVIQGGEVRASNQAALSLVGKRWEEVQGRKQGDFFSCVNAGLPEGCGRTPGCSGCEVLSVVTGTFRSGESRHRVPVGVTARSAMGTRDLVFFVSTQKVGDVVLLEVEEGD